MTGTWVIYLYYTAIALAIILVGLSALGSVDMDHDGHPDLDVDDDHDHSNFLSILGIGKAPFSILMMSYLLSFGVAGVLFCLVGSYLPNFEFLSLVFALVTSVVLTAAFARVVGRFIPSVETYTKAKEDLVGQEGTIITKATPKAGSADVLDSGGSLHRIPVTTISGEIVSGVKVLVVAYNDEKSTFEVERLPN